MTPNKKKNALKSNSHTKRPKISLCMIVKDEAQPLPGCLISVKGLVEEMIIVDTGSADDTVKIAEGHGARVYHLPWSNDFSASRNHALKHATGDWILQLDADEELLREDIPRIRETILNSETNGVYCLFHSTHKDTAGHSQFYLPRLFRNNIGVYYKGRIHETPVIPGNIIFSNIRILHHGYSLDETTMATKKRRNATILLQEIGKNPHDVTTHFYLAKNYYEQGLYDLTLKECQEVLRLLPGDKIAETPDLTPFLETYLLMAYTHYNKGDYQEAEKLCAQAIELKPNYIDPHFFLGHLHLMQEEYAPAIACLQKYLQIREELENNPEFNHLVIYSFTKDHEAHAGLGTAHEMLGNATESVTHLKEAISICPGYAEAHARLGIAYGRQGRLDEAVECLRTALQIKPEYFEAYKNLGILYAMQEKIPLAIETLEKGIQINPHIAELHNDLGTVLAKEGKIEQAIKSFKRAIEINPDYQQAGNNLMLARKKLQERDLAISPEDSPERTVGPP